MTRDAWAPLASLQCTASRRKGVVCRRRGLCPRDKCLHRSPGSRRHVAALLALLALLAPWDQRQHKHSDVSAATAKLPP